jgi:hypothetical protein
VHAECDGEYHFRYLFVRQGLADDDKRLVILAPDMNEWELLWAGNDKLVETGVAQIADKLDAGLERVLLIGRDFEGLDEEMPITGEVPVSAARRVRRCEELEVRAARWTQCPVMRN